MYLDKDSSTTQNKLKNIFFLIIFFLSCMIEFSAGCEDTQYVREGNDATIQFILISPTSGVGYVVERYGNPLITINYNNGGVIVDDSAPGVTFVGDASSGNISFTITKCNGSSAGVYLLVRFNVFEDDCINLNVLGKLNVSLAVSSNKVRVGENVVLTCSSAYITNPSGASFNFRYSWMVGGALEPTYTNNNLTFSNVAQSDHNTAVSCTAREEVTEYITPVESEEVLLTVMFGPDAIVLAPSSTAYTDTEGTTLENITCYADCYPACTYKWTKSGQTISSDGILSLGALMKEKTGIYACVASNPETNDIITTNISIYVFYGPDAVQLFPDTSTHVIDEGASISITCKADCYPNCTYAWVRQGQSSLESNSQELPLETNITRSAAGSYTCSATNPETNQTRSTSVMLYIRYGPDSVQLFPNQSRHVIDEGATISITCKTDCYPNCTYAWVRQGQSSLESNSQELPLETNITRIAAGSYTCSATNPTTNQTRSTSVMLHIRFGPDTVEFTPSTTTYSEKDGTLFSDITCFADCYPICMYHWETSTGTLSSNGTLSLGILDKADTGFYWCLVTNPETNKSQISNITVNVYYGPDTVELIPSTATYSQADGSLFSDITCFADCYPTCMYQWETSTGTLSSNGTLSLGILDKEETGIYWCTVTNPETNKSQISNITVNVYFGPDTVELSPSAAAYSQTEGTLFSDITCLADCYPTCMYQWETSTETLSSNGTLSLGTLDKEETGFYWCTATNPETNKSQISNISVYVFFGPDTIELTPSTATYSQTEGTLFSDITCLADCYPACMYQWETSIETLSSNGTLSLGTLDKEETGLYWCTATNPDTKKSQISNISVNVFYGPDSVHFFPNQSTHAIDEGASISITCTADCYPNCTYVWVRQGKSSVESNSQELPMETNTTRSAAGNYTCSATNPATNQTRSTSVRLYVRYGPDAVVTSPSPLNYAKIEGTTLNDIYCSADCYPTCTFEWKRSKSTSSRNGILSLGTVMKDEADVYWCIVSNPGTNKSLMLNITISVYYGPGATLLFPNQTAHAIDEGGSLNMTCMADCFPDCAYSWVKQGQTSFTLDNNQIYFATNITRNEAGNYTCTSTNPATNTSKSALIEVHIRYGPDSLQIDPNKTVYVVDEGSVLDISCIADCFPTCTVTWFRQRLATYVSNDQDLFLNTTITRSLADNYTCTATNPKTSRSISISLLLQVIYGPDAADVSPALFSYSLTEGSLLVDIICFADCYPSCKFEWTRSHQTLSNNGTLSLGAVMKEESGVYWCKVTNPKTNVSLNANITINVVYGPDSAQIVPNKTILFVDEDSSLYISCIADCYPTCTFAWFREGLAALVSNDTELFANTTISRSAADNYSCIVTNPETKRSVSISLTVFVIFGPDTAELSPAVFKYTETEGSVIGDIICSADCYPICRVKWTKSQQTLTDNGTLSLGRLSKENSGVYLCRVSNLETNHSLTANITVNVRYGPADVQLVPNQSKYILHEGASLNITCLAGCFPNCVFIWTRQKQLSFTSNSQELPYSTNITRSGADNYTCTATNPDTNETKSISVEIRVRYGPDEAIFTPPDVIYNEKESTVLEAITCFAECYPSCIQFWTKSELNISNNGILSLGKLEREDTGTYWCTALNPETNKSAVSNIIVNVYYGPDSVRLVPNQSFYVVDEGESLSITCVSDCFPNCTYYWVRQEQASFVSYDQHLPLNSTITRNSADNYTCSARNPETLQSRSISLTVIVRYGPDSVQLHPNKPTHIIDEGASLPVFCFADCFPNCTYKWFKHGEGSFLSENPMLPLHTTITRNETSNYTCSAINPETKQTKSVTVEVLVRYFPDLSVISEDGNNNPKSGDTVSLLCIARGQPEIYRFNKWIHTAPEYQIKVQEYTGKSNGNQNRLLLQNISYMDSGIYTCSVTNTVKNYRTGETFARKSFNLKVKDRPILISSERRIAADLLGDAIINITFYSNDVSDPQVTWWRREGDSKLPIENNNGRHSVQTEKVDVPIQFYSQNIQQPGYLSQMRIKNVSEDDLTSYEVLIGNSAGRLSSQSSILKKGAPEQFTKFYDIPDRTTTTSVTLTWQPGFHGGAAQTFHIKYRKVGTSEWQDGVTVFGGKKADEQLQAVISGLSENTQYQFKLYAENEYGRGDPFLFTARTSIDQEGRQNLVAIFLVSGSVGGAISIGLFVAIFGPCIAKRCKKRHKSRTGEPKEHRKPHNPNQPAKSLREECVYSNPTYSETRYESSQEYSQISEAAEEAMDKSGFFWNSVYKQYPPRTKFEIRRPMCDH